jgi:hypothetical protein
MVELDSNSITDCSNRTINHIQEEELIVLAVCQNAKWHKVSGIFNNVS